jgi:hypothetical protein
MRQGFARFQLSDYERKKVVDILPRLQAIADLLHEAENEDAIEAGLDALSDAMVLLDKFARMYGVEHNWKAR